tara:strand:+ start:93 stop:344 length:252 start_codon:yes stop_codon:yes gene_type:complete
MITYEEAKEKALEEIKIIKSNAFFEIFCEGCHKVKQIKVFNQGRQNTFCSTKCRGRVFIKNKERKHADEINRLNKIIRELKRK